MAIRAAATVEDVLRLSAQGERYELVDGELVPMSPTGYQHGHIEAFVAWVLNNYVIPRRIGQVLAGEVLFRLDPRAGIARAPDVAFVQHERLPAEPIAGAFEGPPDLAVEVVSPGDSARDIQRKVDDWLDYGASAVLLMYPDTQTVVLWRKGLAASLRDDEIVDLADAVPGFRCAVRELFPSSATPPATPARTPDS